MCAEAGHPPANWASPTATGSRARDVHVG